MFLVAVTGGIASGKSTVSKILLELGCPLVDADQVARQGSTMNWLNDMLLNCDPVVEPGQPSWFKIRKSFGDDVFRTDGTLDRDKLGQIIFADSQQRSLLNSITHPEIYKVIFKRVITFLLKGEQFVVLDLPLLFESGKMLPYINTIIVVNCPPDVQLRRLCARSGLDTATAQQRIDAQMSLEEKCRRATIVIDNIGSIADLEVKVKQIHSRLRASRAHWKLRFLLGCVIAGTFATLIISTRALLS